MQNRIIFGLILLILISFISCRMQQATQSEITGFVDQYEIEAEFYDRQLALQEWELCTRGHSDSLAFYRRAQAEFLSDPETFSKTQRYVTVVGDDQYHRKLELIQRRHLRTIIDNSRPILKFADSLAAIIKGYRFEFEGEFHKRSDLSEIVFSDERRFRREEAYNSLTAMGMDLANGVGTLARLRNQAAVRMGYNSYFDLMLKADGIDREEYFELISELDELSAERYKNGLDSLKIQMNLYDPHIWDVEYALQRSITIHDSYYRPDQQIKQLKATFKGLGLNLDATPIYYARQTESGEAHADVFGIHIPDDIRVMTKLDHGVESIACLFGQTGKAVYLARIDQTDFLLSRSPAPCFEAAMARICAGLIDLDGWKQKYGGLPGPDVVELAASRDFFRLYKLRLMLVYLKFEREMYKKAYSDLDRVYGKIFEEMMMFPCNVDKKPWAMQTAYIIDPVGLQNRLIASCIAAQTYGYLDHKYGSILDNQHTREFLDQNYYRFGAVEDWSTLLERGTGEKLQAKYYLDYGSI